MEKNFFLDGGGRCVIIKAFVYPRETAEELILAAGPHTKMMMPKPYAHWPNKLFRDISTVCPVENADRIEKTFALLAPKNPWFRKEEAVRLGLSLVPELLKDTEWEPREVRVSDTRETLSVARSWPNLDVRLCEQTMSVHSLTDIHIHSARKARVGNALTSWHAGKRRVNIYSRWCVGSRDWLPFTLVF